MWRMSNPVLPPPAYIRSFGTGDENIALPAYSDSPLYPNYHDDVKRPPSYTSDAELDVEQQPVVAAIVIAPEIVAFDAPVFPSRQKIRRVGRDENARPKIRFLRPQRFVGRIQPMRHARRAGTGIMNFCKKVVAAIVVAVVGLGYFAYFALFLVVPALMIYAWAGGDFGRSKHKHD